MHLTSHIELSNSNRKASLNAAIKRILSPSNHVGCERASETHAHFRRNITQILSEHYEFSMLMG